jgi:hypothetical protein
MLFRLALSAARSGVPGAYDRTGSFTGGGAWRVALKPATPAVDGTGCGWLVAGDDGVALLALLGARVADIGRWLGMDAAGYREI